MCMGKVLSKLIPPLFPRRAPQPKMVSGKHQRKSSSNSHEKPTSPQPPAPSAGKEQTPPSPIVKAPKPSQTSEDVGLANGELSQSRRQMLDLVNRLQTTG